MGSIRLFFFFILSCRKIPPDGISLGLVSFSDTTEVKCLQLGYPTDYMCPVVGGGFNVIAVQ